MGGDSGQRISFREHIAGAGQECMACKVVEGCTGWYTECLCRVCRDRQYARLLSGYAEDLGLSRQADTQLSAEPEAAG